MSFLAAMVALSIVRKDVELDISNIEPGTLVRHPLIILKGTTPGADVEAGLFGGKLEKFPALESQFVACVKLQPGANRVFLKSSQQSLSIRIDYRPAGSNYKVRPVFISAADEEPTFMGQASPNQEDIKQRFTTGLMLIQAFTAESMREAGFGLQTFGVDYDKDGMAQIQFVKSLESGAELRKRDGNTLWRQFYEKFSHQFDFGHEKVVSLMGFTQYDPVTKKVAGHTALGGGSFGLFGSGSMRFWPTSVSDIPRAFTDTTPVKSAEMFDDSAYRGTAWANAATTLGAMLHEVGHTFGLPHTSDPRCIMSRGFDHINRSFLIEEPKDGALLTTFGDKGLINSRWDPFFATRLHYHLWFQPETVADTKAAAPSISMKGNDVVIKSEAGLKVVGVWEDGKPNWYEHYAIGPIRFQTSLPLADLQAKIGSKAINVYLMDALGREVNLAIPATSAR